MLKVITIDQSELWDSIVRSFSEHDVYYLSGYVKAFQIHGVGTPLLFYYDNSKTRFICVVMKRVINQNIFPEWKQFFDIITPYGYGGFIFEKDTSELEIREFHNLFNEFAQENNIVSGFFRLHPQIDNAEYLRKITNVIDLGQTIEIGIDSPDVIFKNLSGKNRNMIRKAQKSGVTILHGRDLILFESFIEIYNKTMDRDRADTYYYFSSDFYHSICYDLKDNCEIFYAMLPDNKIIAASIILFANGRMHYHLSGSLDEYRDLAPTNLLLYEAACWGYEQGFKTFHLGGGIGSAEDNLFKFKKSFNPKASHTFSICKQIYMPDIYFDLVNSKLKQNTNFDLESAFFPLYRLQQ
jgi:predicted N-acyltransferase